MNFIHESMNKIQRILSGRGVIQVRITPPPSNRRIIRGPGAKSVSIFPDLQSVLLFGRLINWYLDVKFLVPLGRWPEGPKCLIIWASY